MCSAGRGSCDIIIVFCDECHSRREGAGSEQNGECHVGVGATAEADEVGECDSQSEEAIERFGQRGFKIIEVVECDNFDGVGVDGGTCHPWLPA